MPVSQISGIHIQAPQLVTILSFETVKDYTDYISRLHQLPRVFDETMDNMRLGMADGMMPPKFLLEKAVDQTNEIATAPIDKSPFAQPFEKFPASFSEADKTRLKKEGLDAIQNEVVPAIRQARKVSEGRLRAQGTHRSRHLVAAQRRCDLPVSWCASRPLRMSIRRRFTRSDCSRLPRSRSSNWLSPRSSATRTVKSFAASIATNPKLHAQSREQILDLYRKYIGQMEPKLPELFGHLPKAKLIVMPDEPYREKDASAAEYVPGTPDGSRPGHVMVNTSDPEKRLTINIESTAYHEGVPGHHLQLSMAQEVGTLPPFRQHGFWGAYIEGWALYSERLGKEVGFYQDPYSDYGRLQDEMLRAIRLVVDTGLHYKHWTREQVVQYFHDHSSEDEPNVQSETNRYISWPGQALSYKMGQLEILDLRAHAQKELGSKFDIREFHDQVLDSGALPLDVLQRADQRLDRAEESGRRSR